MHLPVAAVQRYEDDGETTTAMAAWSDRPHPFRRHARAVPCLWAGRTSAADRPCGTGGGLFTPAWRFCRQGARARARQRRRRADHRGRRCLGAGNGRVHRWTPPRSHIGPSRRVHRAAGNRHREHPEPHRAVRFARPDRRRRGRDAAPLERDLHDGIQQRLVSLALKARTIDDDDTPARGGDPGRAVAAG